MLNTRSVVGSSAKGIDMAQDTVAEAHDELDAVQYARASRPTTETNLLIELVFGLVGTLATFFAVTPLRAMGGPGSPASYIYGLIRERGPIQYAELFMFYMVVAHIFMKLRIVKSQLSVLATSPVEQGVDLGHDETVFELRKKVRKLPQFSWSILLNRIDRAFALWLGTKDVSRVSTWAQSEGEREGVNSDATYLRTSLIVGAIPILGFIGTVLGLGTAIAGFSDFLKQGSNLEMAQITASLQEVTGGLGTAFDTTLLALVLSLMAQFPLASVQRKEENLLVEIENYLDDHIVCRFPPQDVMPMEMEAIEDAINSAFRRYIPDPDRYDEVFTRAIEKAGTVIEERFAGLATSYESALQEMAGQLSANLGVVGETLQSSVTQMFHDFRGQDREMIENRRRLSEEESVRIGEMLSELQGRAKDVVAEYHRSAESLQNTTREAAQQSMSAAEDLAKRMGDISRMAAQIEDLLHIEQSIEKSLTGIASSDEFKKTLVDLRQHLASTEDFVSRMRKPKVITLREEIL